MLEQLFYVRRNEAGVNAYWIILGNSFLFGVLYHYIGLPLVQDYCSRSYSSVGVLCRAHILGG